MKDWKTICKKCFFVPLPLIIVMAIISAVALSLVFIKKRESTPGAYVTYVFSFYTLTVACVKCYRDLPGYYKKAKNKVYDNQYANRYLTDAKFNTHVNLYRSLIINLLYVAVNVLSGYLYRSWWFVILSVYYSILAITRFMLLRYVNKNEVGSNRIAELKRSRLCAGVLLMVNLALSGSVLMMLYQNRSYEYHGILIYVMAMYTFYAVIGSGVNLFKYRKYNSPILSTAKVINLAAALVSMLALETAMLSQFGAEQSEESKRLLIILTGAGVSLAVVSMSVYMIVKANREIKCVTNKAMSDSSD